MTSLARICFGTEDLLDKTTVASKVQRNLITIGLGFGLEVLYFPSQWKSITDDRLGESRINISEYILHGFHVMSYYQWHI